jgi:AraC-like DNA-binding protein
VYDNETLQKIQTCRHAWVSGVRTRPITIPSGSGSTMLIIAFKKGRAFPFYPFPMAEIADRIVEADLVFGASMFHLREQLLDAPSVSWMFHLVESFLLAQAGERLYESIPTRCVDFVLHSIIHNPASGFLRESSDQIGYSQKHFIQLFKEQVGVKPKQYLKIMRFQKAISTIERSESIRWSDIALESGYYDQAHLIHDFKLFSGFTPKHYVQRKSSQLNYVPVD